MSSAPSIVCKDCNYVNEIQRVYCHNCGTKLDRSAVVQQDRKGKAETSEEKQKRVRKLMNPGGGFITFGTLKTLFRTLFWGALVAFAISLAKPPANVPPMPEEGIVDALPLGTYLQEITIASAGRTIAFKEADINDYLARTLRPKGDESSPVRFQRAYVKLGDGTIRINSQSAVWKHPIYTGVTFDASGMNGHFNARPREIHLGCITVPQFISQHFGFAVDLMFQSLWGSLKRETKDIQAAGQVVFREGEVLVSSPGTPGAQKAAPEPSAAPTSTPPEASAVPPAQQP